MSNLLVKSGRFSDGMAVSGRWRGAIGFGPDYMRKGFLKIGDKLFDFTVED